MSGKLTGSHLSQGSRPAHWGAHGDPYNPYNAPHQRGPRPYSIAAGGQMCWSAATRGRNPRTVSNHTPSPETDAPAKRFSVRLPSTRHGAHRARVLATAALADWGLPHDTAAHVVAELAANAATHGRVPGRDFRLVLDAESNGVLRIEVTDTRAEKLPAIPRGGGQDAESGRGLVLVTALAARWGVTSGPYPAKTVWAEVEVAEVAADV